MKPYPGLATATTSSWRDSGVRNILENSFFVFYYNLWFFVRQTFVFLTLRSVEQFLTLHSFKRWRCVNIIMFFFFFFFLVPQNFFLNWLFLLSLKIRYVVGRRWQKNKNKSSDETWVLLRIFWARCRRRRLLLLVRVAACKKWGRGRTRHWLTVAMVVTERGRKKFRQSLAQAWRALKSSELLRPPSADENSPSALWRSVQRPM